MPKQKQLTTFEFLAEKVYLPEYMALADAYCDANGGTFDINIREPQVAREHIIDYFTPRGLHICVSQAGIALAEHLIAEGRLGDIDEQTFRKIILEGRLKLVEFYQRWKEEVKASKPIQARFDVIRLRLGKVPVLKLDFNFDKGAVKGNLTSVIARHPVPQTNQDIMRN